MHKRAFERVGSNIKVKFYCSNTDYTGIIINISENGMFITTQKMIFPFDSHFEINLPLENKVLSIPVKVSRITKSGDFFNGIGVEIIDPPSAYLEFVGKLKSS